MTTDLWMLVGTVVLYFVLVFAYSFGRFASPGGFAWAFGNSGDPFDQRPWVARAVRTQQNLTENTVPFAALLLVAHTADKVNELTSLGATIFLVARLLHAGTYIAGIPYSRSAAWFASLIGEAMILYGFIG
jgi:uncharacterized MAPEG superfamily protein